MSLATTIEESRAMRHQHVLNAIHYRRNGMRKSMLAALNLSRCERINSKYFLGPCPF
ncbi:hypothetical protein [Pantoea sp. ACRSB]|uniref:hypothetical protein n=1 Tax=Pantoea sp. ACRSB TaxID=2918207 RepID=UPI002892D7A8|nr:hypothetical protein [Pantoea sp. ACRSB]MCG7388798.1 hypothetical protein [Pantoea sp. ACRSB]